MGPATDVAIVILTLNEATTIGRLARLLSVMDPAPTEVVVVDGGSGDGTVALARAAGLRVIEPGPGWRSTHINCGVAAVGSPLVCVLHADTELPGDAVAVIRRTLADPGTALAGFIALISGAERVWWFTTLHGWVKTWYAPLLFRPLLFLRGLRLLFGDQAMFFRRADFLAVGGCDASMTVLEEAELCTRLARLGRVRLINRVVLTSDRRLARWGELRANWIYLKLGVSWGVHRRRGLERHYPEIR